MESSLSNGMSTAAKVITLGGGAVFGAVGFIALFKNQNKVAMGLLGAISGFSASYLVNRDKL